MFTASPKPLNIPQVTTDDLKQMKVKILISNLIISVMEVAVCLICFM